MFFVTFPVVITHFLFSKMNNYDHWGISNFELNVVNVGGGHYDTAFYIGPTRCNDVRFPNLYYGDSSIPERLGSGKDTLSSLACAFNNICESNK